MKTRIKYFLIYLKWYFSYSIERSTCEFVSKNLGRLARDEYVAYGESIGVYMRELLHIRYPESYEDLRHELMFEFFALGRRE